MPNAEDPVASLSTARRVKPMRLLQLLTSVAGTSRHLPRATIRSLALEANIGPLYEYAAQAFFSVRAT